MRHRLRTIRMVITGFLCLLPVIVIAVTVQCVHAQAFVFPDDPELREQFEAILGERRPLVERITSDQAAGVIDELQELYARGVGLTPGLGAILARDLSRAYDAMDEHEQGREWMKRSTELVEQESSIRGMNLEQAAARTEITASMKRAQDLKAKGELQAAADEFAFASSLLDAAPEDAVRPYRAYQLEFQNAMLLDELGRKDDAYRAYVAAEYHLSRTDHYDTSEGVMLRVFQLEASLAARDMERGAYREGLTEIYESPAFVDVPERVSIVGNRILLETISSGDLEAVESIAEEIFRDVARFERELGKDRIEEIGIPDSYISTASVLAGLYITENRFLDAAATLEHALYAYPDAPDAFSLRKLLKYNYEKLGMLPDERTGVFAGPMSLDECRQLRAGGTLPTSWDEEPDDLPRVSPVTEPVTQEAEVTQNTGDAAPQTRAQPGTAYRPLILVGGIAAIVFGGIVWRRKAA